MFALLSDMILRNGAGESRAVGVGVISYGGCTCLLTAALRCLSLSPEAHLFLRFLRAQRPRACTSQARCAVRSLLQW